MDHDDIRIQHKPHSSSELQSAQPRPTNEQVTTLPAEVEDRLREFIFDLFDLTPLQLMLLSHVRNGGTPNTFGGKFSEFLKSSIIYGKRASRARWNSTVDEIGPNVTRATAWAIWNGMLRKSPILAVFKTWAPGHGGRKARRPRRHAHEDNA